MWRLLILLALAACSVRPPHPPGESRQLVVVTTSGWDSIAGELRRYVREGAAGEWRQVGAAIPVVLGRTGLAWGVGFDSLAAREGTRGPRKREGDGRSPAGTYALTTAFGFAPADSVRTRSPYRPITAATECVDDTSSAHYNRVLERSSVPAVDWRSSERMRQIGQYRLGLIVDYNAPAVKGRGSCIFLHVRAGPRTPTAGCTAMEEAALADLVAWLDPRAQPRLVQLPTSAYARLRAAWGLPEPSR